MFEPVKWIGGENAKEPPTTFRRYTDVNLKRGLAEIDLRPAHSRKLYLVCAGPSLVDTYTELLNGDGEIWALNAAYDWLKTKGIRPDYGICLAAENQILNYFRDTDANDKFLFASQTHPELMDRVIGKGGEVTLWHTEHPWEMPTPKGRRIYGGGTVGSRSFELAYVLGHRDVHVLGMDACISNDGRIAVDIPMYEDRRADLQPWLIGGRVFIALPSHARQVEDFAQILRPLTGMDVTLYGDGMLQWSQHKQENS